MADQPYVATPPDWKRHNASFPEDLKLPPNYSWQEGVQCPTPVFIGQFVIPTGADAYLFGLKHLLSNVKDIDPVRADGHFLECVIQEVSGEPAVTHRLCQHRSVTYSSVSESRDYIPVRKMKTSTIHAQCVGDAPKWKPYDAQWPTLRSVPMKFIAQFNLTKSDITQQLLTWNTALFVFWDQADESSVFKITAQPITYQSATDHYRSE